MLLDIVAKSLYSEKEVSLWWWDFTEAYYLSCFFFKVFVRELVSNASDALEKFRYLSLTGASLENSQRPLQINITADKEAKILTIQVKQHNIFNYFQS